jgi:acetyl-CoA carboxylase biotin carboxyl carrier protein
MVQKPLKDLLDFVKTTDLREVQVESKGFLVSLKRTVEPVRSAAAVSAGTSQTPEGENGSSAPDERMVIRSIMVGTFFRSDSADRPHFVVEGTVVTAGQPVAAIEAMKIMKDVLSPTACKIVKALVANGHAVEYGQPLFEIAPVASDDV